MYGLVLLTLLSHAVVPDLSIAGPYLDLLILGPILISLIVVEGPCDGLGGRKFLLIQWDASIASLFCHSKLTLNH